MFFGSGRKNKTQNLPDGRAIMLNYGYFHLMFIFTVTFKYKYILCTKSSDGWAYKDVTKEEATQLLSGQELKPHWWWRYSLLIGPGLSIVIAIISSIVGNS